MWDFKLKTQSASRRTKFKIISLLLIWLLPTLAFALDKVTVQTGLGPAENVGQFIGLLIDKYAVPLAAVAALIIITYAGFEYVTSGGAPEALTRSKELIVGVVLGLLTVFLIGWFLQSIIPEDELKDANPTPPVTTPASPAAPSPPKPK